MQATETEGVTGNRARAVSRMSKSVSTTEDARRKQVLVQEKKCLLISAQKAISVIPR